MPTPPAPCRWRKEAGAGTWPATSCRPRPAGPGCLRRPRGGRAGWFFPDCYFSNDRPGSIVVFIGDEAPRVYTFASLMIADHIQAALRGDQQWIAPEQLYVGKTGRDVGAWLAERGWTAAASASSGWSPIRPSTSTAPCPLTLQGMAQALPKAEFVPVYKAFFRRASVKSEEELGLVRYAAAIGEAMSETLRATARPGVSEAELVAAVTATCFAMGGYTAEVLLGTGPEYVGWGLRLAVPLASAQGPARRRHRAVGNLRPYGLMETQHQAAVAVGESIRTSCAADVARASYEAGVAALRAGNTFGDLVDAMEAPCLHPAAGMCIRWSTASTLRSGRLWHRARHRIAA